MKASGRAIISQAPRSQTPIRELEAAFEGSARGGFAVKEQGAEVITDFNSRQENLERLTAHCFG